MLSKVQDYRSVLAQRKGVAGLEVLLAVISMLFLIGILVMSFVIAGDRLYNSDSLRDSDSGALANETVTLLNATANVTSVAGLDDIVLSGVVVTNADGESVLHLVDEDVIYYFRVTKDGVVLYTSPDYQVVCQEVPCRINLRDEPTIPDLPNFSLSQNVSFAFLVNESNRTVGVVFASSDGLPSDFVLNVTLLDGYMNNSVCFDSVSGVTSGVLSCVVPDGSNGTHLVTLLRDGKVVGNTLMSLLTYFPGVVFGLGGVIFAFLVVLTLVGVGLDNAIMTILGCFGGVLLAGVMTLIKSGGLFGVGSGIMWLLVGGGILIWKISKRRGG